MFSDTTSQKTLTMATYSGTDDYNLDYRSKKDDAWYTSRVVLEDGKQLRVKFKDFQESIYDEIFSLSDFSNLSELEVFRSRFRRVSEPIEVNECSRVIASMKVCATYNGEDGSVRFFDAIVDDADNVEHTPEECRCTYLLCWQHGPQEGNITSATIDDICLIMPGSIDPKVAEFAKLVKEKLGLLPKKRPFLSRKTSSDETPNLSQDLESVGHNSFIGFSEGRGRFYPEQDDDIDLGGVKENKCYHYIILENLEKDLSPSLMMDFIYEKTSITPQAYVFSSLSIETYARGVLVVDCRTKLEKIYKFLSNPNQFIVSSSGRPWVIAEDILRSGTFNTNLQSSQTFSENKDTGSGLTVVRLGSEEYREAKQLKDLYMEFRKTLNGLFQRLDMEEKKKMKKIKRNKKSDSSSAN